MMIKKLFQLSLLFLLLCGCQTAPKKKDLSLSLPAGSSPILILPPVMTSNYNKEITESLEKHLQLAFTSSTSAPTLSASTVTELQPALKESNLIKDGRLNASEARAIAKTTGSRSVIIWQILDYSPYAPQHLSAIIEWIETESGSTFRSTSVTVDLREKATQKSFGEFIEQRKSFFAKNNSVSSTELEHTLSLNSNFFKKFTAHMIVEKLLSL